MEYTIKKIAELSGISTRTLRYYDEIDLLKPARINSSGYRIYGKKEVDKLQQILFYRSLEMKLEEIQKILAAPDYDPKHALQVHHQQLLDKRRQLDHLILTVEKTLRYQKGEISMTDNEKFVGFKQEKLQENEQTHGKEIREKYGENTVTASNQKWLNLSEDDFIGMEIAEKELIIALKIVMETKNYGSQEAETVFLKHKEWLNYTSPSYSPEMHRGLGQMYVEDERFATYYNERAGAQAAETLNKIIQHFVK
ncbi:MerR family transcriptional regulator [Enterococcus ureilyticus]|uniref:MerR family transcriptional regulator n=1 Tax=Enterococcus ureilyticus TaxID=1131292 RepID=UPI001A9148F8|nr:MerR family transcriptional regulator [Enterococcus ureilyticus]MBO0446712.1 MerR family transcriptional regulator [Enterococcus ureilyticus]